ncbi:hypothetical protein C8K36_108262 [Rhodococcus sp. OK519]|uniref:hypothetical protein n=1 Tax=Rhodococcus sp. OK519 TaxID=2135729 RepID=UPI000D404E41|nr:hypothetical protein C8K36_108262 [Rhodococcus sp. OK519]
MSNPGPEGYPSMPGQNPAQPPLQGSWPAGHPTGPPPHAPAPVTAPKHRPMLIGALAASVGVIIGSIGPWVTFLGLSVGGTEGDGVITLILGVLAAAALGALLTRTAPPRFGLPWAGTAVGAICLLVAIYDMANLSTEDEEFFGKMIGPDIGWGLWLLLLSSIALCATATIAAIQMRRS